MAREPAELAEGESLRGRRASYHITAEGKIGSGGMADVYAALEEGTGRRVAIKVLTNFGPNLLERFKREVILGFPLDHPNLVRIHDAGWLWQGPFFVMDRLEGCTLQRFLEQPEETAHQGGDELPALPADAQWKIQLALYIARGLALLHANEIVHRDVTPRNIFLCVAPAGVALEPKLLDFGIAKDLLPNAHSTRSSSEQTVHGVRIGAPGYTPPEQEAGDSSLIGYHSDVWGLGAVLFRLIEGRKVDANVVDPTARPSHNWSPPLWPVVAKALHRLPQHRYRTTADFARALEPFAGGMKFDVGLPSLQAAAPRARSRNLRFEQIAGTPPQNRLKQRLILGMAATLAVSFVAWQWQPQLAPPDSEPAVSKDGTVSDTPPITSVLPLSPSPGMLPPSAAADASASASAKVLPKPTSTPPTGKRSVGKDVPRPSLPKPDPRTQEPTLDP